MQKCEITMMTVIKPKVFNAIKAAKSLPQRSSEDNKTHGGKALVIAGSKGMYGAAILSSTAAARVGAGYVFLMTDGDQFPTHKFPDFLVEKILINNKKLSVFNSVAMGPGLGVNLKTEKILKKLIKLKIQNVILDADALNVLAKKNIRNLPPSWILTPHEGELARLLGVKSTEIKKSRLKFVIEAQKKYKCVVLLKGKNTLVADAKSIFFVNKGNEALAKAGTGDILTGIIVGFLAQGLDPLIAAAEGAYVHGMVAQQWSLSGKDNLSLLASDMPYFLPKILKKIRNKNS